MTDSHMLTQHQDRIRQAFGQPLLVIQPVNVLPFGTMAVFAPDPAG